MIFMTEFENIIVYISLRDRRSYQLLMQVGAIKKLYGIPHVRYVMSVGVTENVEDMRAENQSLFLRGRAGRDECSLGRAAGTVYRYRQGLQGGSLILLF